MDWTVYNFECGNGENRDQFLKYFDREHPVDIQIDDEAVHEEIEDVNGEPRGAEYAWLTDHDYVYVTALSPVEGLLQMTAEYWDRVVEASFDSTTESLRTATMYESVGGEPIEVAEYDGLPERGGAGLLWRLAVEAEFRFRAYSEGPPTTILSAPITSAYDFIPEENLEQFAEEFETATGIARTNGAMEALRNDPAKNNEPRNDDAADSGDDRTVGRADEVDQARDEETTEANEEHGLLGKLRDLLGL